MYADLIDLREEGVTEQQADGHRVVRACAAATSAIDRACGWWFEPRHARFEVLGRGRTTLPLPVPPIRIESVLIHGASVPVMDFHVEGSPVGPGFEGPSIRFRERRRFPKGPDLVAVEGLFGYLEETPDEESVLVTPPAIRRACILLALSMLAPMASDEAAEVRNRWRLTEERTRDQSYKLDAPASLMGLDPEVEAILLRYRRPAPLGSA